MKRTPDQPYRGPQVRIPNPAGGEDAVCEDCGLTYDVDQAGEPITQRPYTCDDCGGGVETVPVSDPLETGPWRRIEQPGLLLSWRRDLQPSGRHLTVTKTTAGQWRWRLRGPDQLPAEQGGGARVHAEGDRFYQQPARARRAADRYVGPTGFRCPHGCGPLADGGGGPHPQLVCPGCKDEWDAATMAAPVGH